MAVTPVLQAGMTAPRGGGRPWTTVDPASSIDETDETLSPVATRRSFFDARSNW
jgi:hypothetical protein